MTNRRGRPPIAAKRTRGFTLIEVLVVAILMMIVIGTVAVVFGESTEIIARNEARTQVYVSAGYAIDRLTNDFYGCLPFTGAQRFVMHNGDVGAGAIADYYTYVSGGGVEAAGAHYNKAADLLSMRSITSAGNISKQLQVTYYLKKDADPWRQATARTSRPIYTLMRRVREPGPLEQGVNSWKNWTQVPQVDTGSGLAPIPDEEICHYVLSCNIEYLASNMNYSQLDASTCPSGKSPCPWSDPLGDGDPLGSGGVNDTPVPAAGPPFTFIPYRIPAVRITLVVVDDFGERSERMITHVFQIPMG